MVVLGFLSGVPGLAPRIVRDHSPAGPGCHAVGEGFPHAARVKVEEAVVRRPYSLRKRQKVSSPRKRG